MGRLIGGLVRTFAGWSVGRSVGSRMTLLGNWADIWSPDWWISRERCILDISNITIGVKISERSSEEGQVMGVTTPGGVLGRAGQSEVFIEYALCF